MSKPWLIFLVALVLVPLASIALVLRSESVLLDSLEWAVDNLTDFDLQLVNPRIDFYAGTVSADELHLFHDSDTATGPALVSVQALEGHDIRWPDLLLSTLKEATLSASSVLIYVSDNDETSNPEPITWLSYLSWLPRRASIGVVHLITHRERVWIFPLEDVSGYRGDYVNFIASAKAFGESEPLDLVIELHALHDKKRFFGVELSAELDALASGGSATLSGEIRGTESDYEYDLEMVANYPAVEDFFDNYPGIGQRLRGKLIIEGMLHGDSRSVQLNAQTIILDNMPDYGIEVSGTLSRSFEEQDTQIDAISAGEIASLEPLSQLFGVDLSQFGRAQANATISGTLASPQIDHFILATQSASGLSVNASGRLSSNELADGDALAENEISVDISGPDLARLEPWLGELAIDPGPWSASAIVTGDKTTLSLKQLKLEAGTVKQLELRGDGAIESIDIATSPFTPDLISGIDMAVHIVSEDSGKAGALLGLELPGYHELDGYLELRGNGSHLTGSKGRLTASSSDLELTLSDITGTAIRGEKFELTDFSAAVTGELSDTSALSQYTERPAISLGPLSLQAELKQSSDGVSAENVLISVTGESLQIQSKGRVGNLLTMGDVALNQDFYGLNTGNVLATLIEDFTYPHDLGNLVGSFEISGSPETLQVNALTLTNKGSDRLTLSINGSLKNLDELDADLAFQTNIPDTGLLRALSGLQLAETVASGTLKTHGSEVRLQGDMTIGQTRLSTDTDFSTGDGRLQSLDMSIRSPHLYLSDLGLQADNNGKQQYRPADQIEDAAEGSLERMLNRAPRFPSRIRLSIDELTGENTAIDSIQLEVTGRDGAYTVRQLDANYAAGKATFRGIVDLNQTPAVISLAGQGISIPLNRLSADVGIESDVEGILSFRGGITAQGKEREDLLRSLDGSMAFALEDATIEGAAYDVLATGILEWMYSGAALEKSTRLDCTMAHFDFDGGKARTDNIFIETSKMIATGEATLDLVKSEIDLSLTPRSKSRQVHIPSTVRVKGPMSKPRTIVSPVSAAADAYAEALVLIPNLTLKLFGIKRDSKKQTRPCEAAPA